MDFKPKTEPGSRPSGGVGDVGDDKMLINMSIPDLISELRIATRIKQFDQLEKVLVAREAQLKGEVEKMREILDCERLDRMKIEEELKEYENKCEKGKRAEELYEKLLAEVKKNGLEDGDTTVDELRTKNSKLEGELEIWKKKFVELNERILRLEYDTQLLMKGGNNEEDYGADLGVTFEVKEKKETNRIHVYGGYSGNNNADSTISQRNGDTCAGIGQSSSSPNKDASASGRLGLETIIEIEDSDGDDKKEETSQFVTDNGHPSSSVAAVHQKSIPRIVEDVIGMLKRKFASRDCPRQFQKYMLDNGFDNDVSSSSSSESSDMEQLLRRCRHHTIDKRRKT